MAGPVKKPPLGLLTDTITYLEMMERPGRPPLPIPAGKLALMRVERCPVPFYRYLYDTVGEPWVWFERRLWSDKKLAATLAQPETEVTALYVAGVPAGYFEIDRRPDGNVQLAYFGLAPDFIERGLGAWFMRAAVDQAWLHPDAKRFWVHTCTYDHPRALGAYQKAGFQVYRQQPVEFTDPRLLGALRRDHPHPKLPPLPT